MPIDKSGFPAYPEQSFTMASATIRCVRASDLSELPTWALAGVDDTRAIAESPSSPQPHDAPDEDSPVAYRLLRRIGKGGMGEVWEAEQCSLNRVIAVKRLLRQQRNDGAPDTVEDEFHTESVIAAGLEHPNILPVYDLGRAADGNLLLAMKRVRGESWNDLLRAEFADTPVESFLARHIPILMAVTQAVAFAHSRGIVHRDIKPAQVMVGEFGEVLLTDWGLAIQVGEYQGRSSSLATPVAPTPITATNPAGTPALMAPEQTLHDGGKLGFWTDVYLLGGTLYYLLTGSYPHASESSQAAFELARSGGLVQPPSARVPQRHVPPELERLCLKALEPEQQERLPSADAFLKGLHDYLSGAARKEKSAELVAQAEQCLAGSGLDYAAYTAATTSLDEAHRLWPDNPKLPGLRQRNLFGSARLALEQGDLSFARLQCEAMGDSEQAGQLRTDIERRRREVARRKSMLRIAAAAVFGLLLVIAGGAVMFSQRMQAANEEIAKRVEEAEHALDIARSRGSSAFELIEFVLNDLKAALDEELTPERGIAPDTGNQIAHAVSGKVARPIVSYFEQAEPESWPKEMQTEHADRMNGVGAHFRLMARHDEALQLFAATRALRERILGPNHEDVARTINEMAILNMGAGRYEEAEPLLRRTLEIAAATYPPDAPEIGELSANFGLLLLRMGKLQDAEAQMTKAVAIFEKNPDYYQRDRLPVAMSFLANVRRESGDLEGAETLLRRALALFEERVGQSGTHYSFILNDLGLTLDKLQRHDEAELVYRRILEILEPEVGPHHPNVGKVSSNLGAMLRRSGQLAAAEPLLRRALAIYEASFGPDHVDVGKVNHGLGLLFRDANRLPEARTALKRAEEILGARLGAEHTDTVSAKEALAEVESRLAAPSQGRR